MANGWCHHPNSESKWCGWLSCYPEGQHINYPACCGNSSEGCGGIDTLSQVQGSSSAPVDFGTGKPVGSDLEIALLSDNMVGADGSKAQEKEINSVSELVVDLFGIAIPVILVGALIYVGIRRLG